MSLFLRAIFAIVLGLPSFALAYDIPKFTGNVIDQAGILSPEVEASLHQKITELQEDAGILPAILVTGPLGDESIESVANRAFREYKLGSKNADNGILIVLSPTERKMRIEVGYGLEGSITDADSIRIIDSIMKPDFRKGDYGAGFLGALDAIKERRLVRDDSGTILSDQADRGSSRGTDLSSFAWVVAGFIFFNWFCTIALVWFRRRQGEYISTGRVVFMCFLGGFIGLMMGGLAHANDASDAYRTFGGMDAVLNMAMSLLFTFVDFGKMAGGSSDPSSSSLGWSDSSWGSSSDSSSSDSSSSDSSSSSDGGDSGGGGASGDY